MKGKEGNGVRGLGVEEWSVYEVWVVGVGVLRSRVAGDLMVCVERG